MNIDFGSLRCETWIFLEGCGGVPRKYLNFWFSKKRQRQTTRRRRRRRRRRRQIRLFDVGDVSNAHISSPFFVIFFKHVHNARHQYSETFKIITKKIWNPISISQLGTIENIKCFLYKWTCQSMHDWVDEWITNQLPFERQRIDKRQVRIHVIYSFI